MLHQKLKECDAVIHIAGFRYGAEPDQREVHEPRRSYTQMEFDAAVGLGKEVYLFLADEGFPFDDAGNPEDEERRALQLAHRESLKKRGTHYTAINSEALLREKLRELDVQVNQLKKWIAEQEKELEEQRAAAQKHRKELDDFKWNNSVTQRLLQVAIILQVLLLIVFGWSKLMESNKKDQTEKLLVQVGSEMKSNPEGSWQVWVSNVAAKSKMVPQVLARDFDTYMKVASYGGSSPAVKERAAFLNQNAAANAVLAAPKWDDPAWKDKSGALTAASAYFALEQREKKRNSFGAGLTGPVQFVFAFLGHALGPQESAASGTGILDGYREMKELKMTQTGSAPHSAVEEPVVRPRYNMEDYVKKKGDPSESEEESTSLFSPSHWASAISKVWDDTWGLGPGNYRIGFIFGWVMLVVFIREDRARRQGKWKLATKGERELDLA